MNIEVNNLTSLRLYNLCAFHLGLLLKDSIFGGMKDTFTTMMYSNYDSGMYDAMSGYEVPPSVNYVSPSSYYGDPTRVFDSSEGEEIIGSYIFVVSKI